MAAVCIAGQLRTFVLPWVLDHWQAAVFTPLAADLFLQVSPEGGGVVYETLTAPRDVRLVRQQLRPVRFQLLTDADVLASINMSVNTSRRVHFSRKLLHGGIVGTLTLRWERCLSDIEEVEAVRALRYTWIVRARPDMVFRCALPPLALWPTLHAGRPTTLLMADYLLAAPRPLAAPLLRVRARLANSSAAPCGMSILEHTECADSMLHELGANACEMAPRAHLLRFRELPLRHRPPRSLPTCSGWTDRTWNSTGGCVSAERLNERCRAPKFLGFWRCGGADPARVAFWAAVARRFHRETGSHRPWWLSDAAEPAASKRPNASRGEANGPGLCLGPGGHSRCLAARARVIAL